MGVNINTCKCLVSNENNKSNLHPHEVVGRGSQTTLQVEDIF